MITNEGEVLAAIYQALATLNEERADTDQIEIGPETCLFGEGSVLDSLSLVSVIVDLETLVSDKFGRTISLTDDRAMNHVPVPFTDVGALKSYILELLSA
jgi:acyl carrier protein